MRIRISIVREYDTEGDDHAHLFEGLSKVGAQDYALRLFAEDVDNMVALNAVEDDALVEVAANV